MILENRYILQIQIWACFCQLYTPLFQKTIKIYFKPGQFRAKNYLLLYTPQPKSCYYIVVISPTHPFVVGKSAQKYDKREWEWESQKQLEFQIPVEKMYYSYWNLFVTVS